MERDAKRDKKTGQKEIRSRHRKRDRRDINFH